MKFERFECLADKCQDQVTINSSQHFQKYHGKSFQNLVKEEHGDKILELHQEGLSIKDVAEKINISYISKEMVRKVLELMREQRDDSFQCPIEGCEKYLEKLQYQHFYFKHDKEPVEAMLDLHGGQIRKMYQSGLGVYRIAEKTEEQYLTREIIDSMVRKIDIRRNHKEALEEYSPMRAKEVRNNHPAIFGDGQKPENGYSEIDWETHPLANGEFTGENHPRWNSEPVECSASKCEKIVSATKYRRESRKNIFCSLECKREAISERTSGKDNPNYKHGGYIGKPQYIDYGSNWARKRAKALERDNNQCVVCKSEENLHVHHKIPIGSFFSREKEMIGNNLVNLETVCESCHHEKHRNLDRKKIIENKIQVFTEVV